MHFHLPGCARHLLALVLYALLRTDQVPVTASLGKLS
jgi:hypothetical protein